MNQNQEGKAIASAVPHSEFRNSAFHTPNSAIL